MPSASGNATSRYMIVGQMDDTGSDTSDDEESNGILVLHPGITSDIDTKFECPLATTLDHTISTLRISARQGCPHCILRIAAITSLLPALSDSAEVHCSHDYIFLPFYVAGQRIVLASDEQGHDLEEDRTCEFYGDHLGGIGSVERIVPCDTNSSKSLETVKKWITTCDEEHDCMKETGPGPGVNLPKQLIDVRIHPARLYETFDTDHGMRYACLSHCWGKPSSQGGPPTAMLRTTPSTFKAYCEAIPWTDMPRTFQDAVSFTRKLDIAFLWIDSLCIVQDEFDKTDWQEQSANMAKIYRQAYITLAATAAQDAGGGCYTPKDVPHLHQAGPPLAVIQYRDGTRRDLFARREFNHDMSSLPLLQRGWVYQERLLSPRVLHFVGEELVWECNQNVSCECRGDDLEDKFDRMRIFDPEYVVVGPHCRHSAPLDLWYQIVSDYTALSLTKASDVFPALSGIAKEFAKKIGGEYVAGMWKSTLVPNMLWYFQEEEEETIDSNHETQSWRAPSWSWASREQQTDFRVLPTTKELAEVTSVECLPTGIDPAGELVSASLTLKTKVLPARFDRASKTIHLNEHVIPKASANVSSYSIVDLCTGYIDLDTAYLTTHSDSSILLAQLSECTRDRRIYLYGVHDPIHVIQHVRSYMILARHVDKNGWIRLGLATIAEYEPNVALFAEGGNQVERLKCWTREEIVIRLEESARHNRALMRCFDEVERTEVVVY
jgi:hypothetical protein